MFTYIFPLVYLGTVPIAVLIWGYWTLTKEGNSGEE